MILFTDQCDIPMSLAASPKPERPWPWLIDLRSAWELYSCANTTFSPLNVVDSLT